jgi:hypothetical protein
MKRPVFQFLYEGYNASRMEVFDNFPALILKKVN